MGKPLNAVLAARTSTAAVTVATTKKAKLPGPKTAPASWAMTVRWT